jgi:glycosyltransferase involved in cell wall biosynthesis
LKTKIAFIIPTLSLGGAEKQQVNILNDIDTSIFKVKLYILKNQTQLLNQITNKEIEIEICNINSSKELKNFFYFLKNIKTYNPNIIHAQMYNANILSRLIKIILPKSKIINHFHGMSEWMSKPKLILDKITSKLVDKFIVVSPKSFELRLRREKYPKEKTTILYNSVNLEANITDDTFNLNKENLTVGMASRLIPLKNIKAAIYMLSKLLEKGLDIKLTIAGDGPEKENLIEYAKELNILKRVTFLGFVNDMQSFYEKIDIYCISSITEDLPLSVIESMMLGKPIIASNIGGIPDILKDINYSILVHDFYSQGEINDIYNMLENCNNYKCAKYLNEIAFRQFDNKAYCNKLTMIYKELS